MSNLQIFIVIGLLVSAALAAMKLMLLRRWHAADKSDLTGLRELSQVDHKTAAMEDGLAVSVRRNRAKIRRLPYVVLGLAAAALAIAVF